MQTAAGHILQNGSAKRHVDQLHAFADAEDGLVLPDAELQRLKLENIQFCVNMIGAIIFFSEESGRDISAAGQKESGTAADIFGRQRGDK